MKNNQFIRWELHQYSEAEIVKVFHIIILAPNTSEEIKKPITETVYEEIFEIRDPKTCHIKKWPRYVGYHIGSENITNYETGTIEYQIIPQTDLSYGSSPIHHKFLFSQSISSDKNIFYNLNMDISVSTENHIYTLHLHFRQERKQKKMIPFFEQWKLVSISYSLDPSDNLHDTFMKLQPIVSTVFHEFHQKMTIDLVSPHYWPYFESAYHFQKGINYGNLLIIS